MLFYLIGSVLSGALVGWLAGIVMNQPGGAVRNIVVGIVGSALGHTIFRLVGFYAYGWIADLIVSIVGACVLLAAVNWLSRR